MAVEDAFLITPQSARCGWATAEAAITQALSAAEPLELTLVKREHHLDREELDLDRHLAHLASFRYVSSCASISRWARARAPSALRAPTTTGWINPPKAPTEPQEPRA